MTLKHVDNMVTTTDKSAVEDATTDKEEHPRHIARNAIAPNDDLPPRKAEEFGGQAGLEPTRYGDWEKKGRCTDF